MILSDQVVDLRSLAGVCAGKCNITIAPRVLRESWNSKSQQHQGIAWAFARAQESQRAIKEKWPAIKFGSISFHPLIDRHCEGARCTKQSPRSERDCFGGRSVLLAMTLATKKKQTPLDERRLMDVRFAPRPSLTPGIRVASSTPPQCTDSHQRVIGHDSIDAPISEADYLLGSVRRPYMHTAVEDDVRAAPVPCWHWKCAGARPDNHQT